MLGLANRDIIFSIKPNYADKIMSGVKTVELRRRFTNEAPIGARAFIYSTAPTRAMVGYATISDVRRLPIEEIWRRYGDQSGIARAEFEAYFHGLSHGYVIALRNPRRFHISAGIHYLRERFGFRAPQSYGYAGTEYRELTG